MGRWEMMPGAKSLLTGARRRDVRAPRVGQHRAVPHHSHANLVGAAFKAQHSGHGRSGETTPAGSRLTRRPRNPHRSARRGRSPRQLSGGTHTDGHRTTPHVAPSRPPSSRRPVKAPSRTCPPNCQGRGAGIRSSHAYPLRRLSPAVQPSLLHGLFFSLAQRRHLRPGWREEPCSGHTDKQSGNGGLGPFVAWRLWRRAGLGSPSRGARQTNRRRSCAAR